jgi:hypothetical protein
MTTSRTPSSPKVAIGWSGQWSATVRVNADRKQLHLSAGIPDIHLRLQPAEEIPGPRILIGAYRGAIAAGSNRLRRLIRERYTPSLDGKPFDPPSPMTIGGTLLTGSMSRCCGAWRMGRRPSARSFLLDAGWYAGTGGPEGFSAGVGNWKTSTGRSSSMRPFADYVRGG